MEEPGSHLSIVRARDAATLIGLNLDPAVGYNLKALVRIFHQPFHLLVAAVARASSVPARAANIRRSVLARNLWQLRGRRRGPVAFPFLNPIFRAGAGVHGCRDGIDLEHRKGHRQLSRIQKNSCRTLLPRRPSASSNPSATPSPSWRRKWPNGNGTSTTIPA